MITGSEILKDLETIKKKAEFAEVIYSNNDIWPTINKELTTIIHILEKDMKMFGYGSYDF